MRQTMSAADIESGPSSRHWTRAGWSLTCQRLHQGIVSRVAQLGEACAVRFRDPPAEAVAGLAAGASSARHARRLVFDFDDAVLFRDSYDRRGPHSRRRAAAVRRDRPCGRRRHRRQRLPGRLRPPRRGTRRARPAHPHLRGSRTATRRQATGWPGDAPAGHVDLVWIGSSSTLQGLEQRRTVWERLGREIPGLRLRVICDRFPDFAALPVVPVPWSEETEARDLAAGDDRDQLAARRPLEPGQVRPEGPPVPGRRAAGRRQSGGHARPSSSSPGPPASCRDAGSMGRRPSGRSPPTRIAAGGWGGSPAGTSSQATRSRPGQGPSCRRVAVARGATRTALGRSAPAPAQASGAIPDPFFVRLADGSGSSRRSATRASLDRNDDLD